jgi:hypothetical protein
MTQNKMQYAKQLKESGKEHTDEYRKIDYHIQRGKREMGLFTTTMPQAAPLAPVQATVGWQNPGAFPGKLPAASLPSAEPIFTGTALSVLQKPHQVVQNTEQTVGTTHEQLQALAATCIAKPSTSSAGFASDSSISPSTSSDAP